MKTENCFKCGGSGREICTICGGKGGSYRVNIYNWGCSYLFHDLNKVPVTSFSSVYSVVIKKEDKKIRKGMDLFI